MAVNAQPDPALLACGHDAAEVWDRAAAGRLDAHARQCPHCRAVAGDQRRLSIAVEALANDTLEPPPSLVERVMGAVLAELRPTDYLPLPTRHGRARIDRTVAAGVLRHAVDQMSALRVRSCQIQLPEPSGTEPSGTEPSGSELSGSGETNGAVLTTSAPTARVLITVTARFGADLISATARVRQMIMAAAEDLLGLPVTAVDVEVIDVFDDPVRPTR